MSYRRLPLSTPQREIALRQINDRKAVTPPANLPFKTSTMEQFDLLYPVFKEKVLNIGKTLSAQGGITTKVVKAKRAAQLHQLDFLDALQNAIRRGVFHESVRALYALPVEKRWRPKIQTEADVLEWGENIHDGETKRIALGGAPITFPSLAEVDAATNDFKTKNNQQSNDKYAFDTAQEELADISKKANQLIRRCWNEIETAFDDGDKPSMRRKARDWGVVYIETKKDKEPQDPRL